MAPRPPPRSSRRSARPHLAIRHWRVPARGRAAGCRRDRPCRTARRSDRPARPSPCNRASAEASEALLAFVGSSPITASRLRRSVPEARVLPSPGVTRLHRYYDPLRLPPRPPSTASRPGVAARAAPIGISHVARTALPTCRPHYPGGPRGCAHRLLPRSCCLPHSLRGSASTTPLSRRARSSLALRPAGSLDRQKPPLSRSVNRPVSQRSRSSATEPPISIRMDPSSIDSSRLSWRTKGHKGFFARRRRAIILLRVLCDLCGQPSLRLCVSAVVCLS